MVVESKFEWGQREEKSGSVWTGGRDQGQGGGYMCECTLCDQKTFIFLVLELFRKHIESVSGVCLTMTLLLSLYTHI